MTSSTLKPWYAVATPHEDIREGRLSEAVFAANLWAAAFDQIRSVYQDDARVHMPVDWQPLTLEQLRQS